MVFRVVLSVVFFSILLYNTFLLLTLVGWDQLVKSLYLVYEIEGSNPTFSRLFAPKLNFFLPIFLLIIIINLLFMINVLIFKSKRKVKSCFFSTRRGWLANYFHFLSQLSRKPNRHPFLLSETVLSFLCSDF